jgi:hypothetical protein
MNKDHSYRAWQETLSDRYFSANRAGLRVRLNIDEDDFPIEGGDVASLIAAVHAEVKAEDCETILELLAKQAERFQRLLAKTRTFGDPPPDDPPCVLPNLALLVLAVHHGGDQFPPHEYYDRLRDLMGYDGIAEIDSGPMRKAGKAWTTVEEWSTRLQMGRRGLFEVRVLGGNRYIGVPLRQALLSPADEDALETTFIAEGLEPSRDLGTGASLRLARATSLRARAKKVLAEYPRTRASRELVDDVIDVYEAWDGQGRSIDSIGIKKRPIRLRFQNRFPVLENVAATCVLPTDLKYQAAADAHDVRLESTEMRDGGSELIRKNGSSTAEDIDWFSTVRFNFVIDGGRRLECFRTRHRCRWFAKQSGVTWVEQFEDELEVDRTYVEVRRTDDLTDVPGAGSGGFHGAEWKALEHPSGLHVRTFRFEPPATDRKTRRISGRIRGGIRTKARGATYYDFAVPDLLWPRSPDGEAKVVLRAIGRDGNIVYETTLVPAVAQADSSGFGEGFDVTPIHVELPLQQTVDDLMERGIEPALIEAFLEGSESNSKLRVYLERTTASVELPEPPRRSRIGAIDETGSLSGRVGLGGETRTIRLDATQMGPPLRLNTPVPTTDAPHDRLCRLLRSRSALPWSKARDQIRQCGRDETFDDRHNLSSQLFSMHQMGVVEIVESPQGGLDRIQALPPRLAITVAQANLGLARRGGIRRGRRFLLTGAWLPREIVELQRLASSTEDLEFHQTADTDDATLLPPERCVLTSSKQGETTLGKLAGRLGIQFEDGTPDAVSSLSCIAAISETEALLDWRPGIPGAGYETFEFDINRICRTNAPTEGRPFRLLECKRRDSGLWIHYLVDDRGNRHAAIQDRQLGRWIVRRLGIPEAPLPVDSAGALIVPLELRLPRHLERAFALESERPPETVWFGGDRAISDSPFLDRSTSTRFHIPSPTTTRVRPYAVNERCCHAFLRYPGVHGTPLWPTGKPMPMLECQASKIATLGLNGDDR